MVGLLRRRYPWANQDLNLEPAGYEPAALTVELLARVQILWNRSAKEMLQCGHSI